MDRNVPSDWPAATPELQPAVDYARIEEGFHVIDDAVFVLGAGDAVKANSHRYNILVEVVNSQRICRSSAFDIIEGARPSP